MVKKPLIRPCFLGGVALGEVARIPMIKRLLHMFGQKKYAFLRKAPQNMHFEYAFWDVKYAFLTYVAVGLPKLINLTSTRTLQIMGYLHSVVSKNRDVSPQIIY